MASRYYEAGLSAERLRACYRLASARLRQYLDAEIAFVASKLGSRDTVLELGCGYGRVAAALGSGRSAWRGSRRRWPPGLIGPIDPQRTRDGTIVCADGFRSGTLTPPVLAGLCERLAVDGEIDEIDGSSVFCTMARPPSGLRVERDR